MAVSDAHVFPGFLTLVITQLFFPKPPTTFLTFFCRGEWRKYAGKFASIGDRTHSHKIMSSTRSPLSHPSEAALYRTTPSFNKKKNLLTTSATVSIMTLRETITLAFYSKRCADYVDTHTLHGQSLSRVVVRYSHHTPLQWGN